MKNNFFDKKTIGIFIFFFIIYLYFLVPVPSPTSNLALEAAISFVDRGKFEVNKDIIDAVCYKEKCYPIFPPGLSLLAIPVYVITKPLLKFISPFVESDMPLPEYATRRTAFFYDVRSLNFFCIILIIIPILVLLMIFFYKFLGEFTENEKQKLLTTIFLGVGTIMFYYSTFISRNTIGIFLLFLSFYILFKMKHKNLNIKFLPLTGFLAGAVFLFHYFQISVTILLFFYLLTFIRDRRIFLFISGMILPILGILVYQWSFSGNPFLLPYYIENYQEIFGIDVGFFGWSLPHLKTIYSLLFSPYKGLFFYSPILILAFYGLFLKIKSRFSVEMWFILAVFLVVFLSNASLQKEIWWNGSLMAFGPRYLLTMIPFLMIPLVFVFNKLKEWVIILIGIISIFINYLGASTSLLHPSQIGIPYEEYGKSRLFFSFYNFIQNGPTSPLIEFLFSNNLLLINIAGLFVLGFFLFIIWKKFSINDVSDKIK